jgi:hypothetical protein
LTPNALLDTHLGPFYVKRDRNNVLLNLTLALAHVHPEFHISKLKLKPIEEPGRFPARPNQEYPEPKKMPKAWMLMGEARRTCVFTIKKYTGRQEVSL